MGKTVKLHLQPVRSRQRLVRSLWSFAWGLLFGSALGLLAAVAKLTFLPEMAVWVPLALPAMVALLAAVVGWVWPRHWRDAASAIDTRYGLKDRATTALEFASRGNLLPVQRLAFQDALTHLERIKPQEVVPLRLPRVLPFAMASLMATLVLVVFAIWNAPAIAEPPEALPVIVAQADRAAEELAELAEYAENEQDPELEKLVKELKAAIEEMKQPGTDVREALAKLSEMQAALQAEQAKHNTAAADAQFQAIGEALALAEPLAEAGQALSAGQYEKAAEELAKVELPELDRQTEKAMKEKLEQAAKQASNNGQNSLSAAAGEMSQGLGGEGRKFTDGSKKLAGEAKKQSRRKKLTDLLQKQCNCLGECKSECEGNCKSPAKGKSNGKGGKNWGLGASDGELGERTPQLGGQQEKITGQQSDEGEVETETTHSPEGSQQAQRAYRENYAKYKKISEAVLDSEPIPLGHRQTIRRYFESIRPNDAEMANSPTE